MAPILVIVSSTSAGLATVLAQRIILAVGEQKVWGARRLCPNDL